MTQESAQPAGVDLARVALQAAREAAKKRGGAQPGGRKPKRRTKPARREGRDPQGLGDAITAMMAERAWKVPAAGGEVLARWSSILEEAAPDLAGHVAAVAFDPATGQLDVMPDAPAYGTKVRWSAPKLIAHVNNTTGGAPVRTIHVRAPGRPATSERAAEPSTAPPATRQPLTPPVKTRDTASAGYHQALAAYQETARCRPATEPRIRAAVQRQLRDRLREPEGAFAEGQEVLDQLKERETRRGMASPSEVSQARALKRLADERAGRVDSTPRGLRRTA